MSVWSSVDGTLVISKDKHFSLQKYTNSFFDECFMSIHQKNLNDNLISITFSVSISMDGIEAAHAIELWSCDIPGDLDFTANIRWVR